MIPLKEMETEMKIKRMTNRYLRMQHTASEIVVLEPRKMNPKYVSLPVKDDDQSHRAHPVKGKSN
jgi:hypothetical protein